MPVKYPKQTVAPTFVLHHYAIDFLFEPTGRLKDDEKKFVVAEIARIFSINRLAAILEVLGATILRAKPSTKPYQLDEQDEEEFIKKNKSNYDPEKNVYYKICRPNIFTRDLVVPLPGNIMIYPKKYPGPKIFNTGFIASKQAIKSLTSNFQYIPIENSFFEGGNLILMPYQGKYFLLHNLDPLASKYIDPRKVKKIFEDPNQMNNDIDKIVYRIDPKETSKKIQNEISQLNIEVVDINIDIAFLKETSSAFQVYHLDCFMQVIADRLFILNKKLLTKASQEKLISLFGNKFIDLEIPLSKNYESTLFNLVTLGEGDNIVVVAPLLDSLIVNSLEKHGISVITPNTLNPKKPQYNKDFSGKVAKRLQEMGYHTATESNLLTPLLENTNGYDLEDGSHLDLSFFQDKGVFIPRLRNIPHIFFVNNFLLGSGGPHCLTLQINTSVSNLSMFQSENKESATISHKSEIGNTY